MSPEQSRVESPELVSPENARREHTKNVSFISNKTNDSALDGRFSPTSKRMG